jgi:hypothetical protein
MDLGNRVQIQVCPAIDHPTGGGSDGVRSAAPSIRKEFVVRLPPTEQVGERLRPVGRRGLARPILLIHAVDGGTRSLCSVMHVFRVYSGRTTTPTVSPQARS